uniref:Uncharacterized protein n=1 Tax=Rhizophora mucronata TaxID=61149 RepID=A0A2P2P865_RHIMU
MSQCYRLRKQKHISACMLPKAIELQKVNYFYEEA